MRGGNLRTAELYRVVAIHGKRRKTVASAVGGFRATRLANAIRAKGFRAEVTRVARGAA